MIWNQDPWLLNNSVCMIGFIGHKLNGEETYNEYIEIIEKK